MIKPGYKTSEFWFTLVSFVFSGLFLLGLIKDNQNKEELISVVSHAVESTILISGQLLILYRYIKGRTEVKKVIEEKHNVSKRTSPKRSRKTSKRSPKVS